MCGFAGVVDLRGQPVDRAAFDAVHAALRVRAFDGDTAHWNGDAALAFARTVMDPGRPPASQPLSHDGRCWIVADARLDGRASLIEALRGAGWEGADETSDAALVLVGYQVWGDAVVDNLLGDFSFLIWDRDAGRLLAARDHLGVKPLYFAEAGDLVVVSNSLTAVRAHPAIGDRLDEAALADFLLFEGNQSLDATSFAAIRRLPPAHVRTWRVGGGADVRRYWQLPTVVDEQADDDWVVRFRALVDTAVEDRLPDGGLAILLSGGLDSNLVAASAARMRDGGASEGSIHAFTTFYQRLVPDREAEFARLGAEHSGLAFHPWPMDDWALFDRWPSLPSSPEPIDAIFDADTRVLEAMMSDQSRVVLSGHGGDPILSPARGLFWRHLGHGRLGAATRYLIDGYRQLGHLPPLGLHTRWHRWRQRRAWRDGYPDWLAPDLERRAQTEARWRWHRFGGATTSSHPRRPEVQSGLMDPCWPSYFERIDPGSRGRPLEHRHPLLDVRLIELAMALPPSPWCLDKQILREAARGRIPEAVRCRPKSPVAGNPVHPSARPAADVWRELVRDVPAIEAFVAPRRVTELLVQRERAGRVGRLDGDARRPLNLALWLRGLGSRYQV